MTNLKQHSPGMHLNEWKLLQKKTTVNSIGAFRFYTKLYSSFQYAENENDAPIPLEKAVQLKNLQGFVVYIEYQVT